MRISSDMSGPTGSTLSQEKLLLQPRQRDLLLNVPLSFYTPLGKLLEDVFLSNKPAEELAIVINFAAENQETTQTILDVGELPTATDFTCHPTNMIALLQTLSIDANCFFHV